MLAKPGPLPTRSGWAFEPKWDGTAWSPDGTRIATMDRPTRTIYTINATDGSDPQAVHPGPGPQFVPGWQPLGKGTQGEDG